MKKLKDISKTLIEKIFGKRAEKREEKKVERNLSAVVESNLLMMCGRFEGGMYSSIDESVGGMNRWQGKYPVYWKNFYYGPETGEIKYFGNCQHVPVRFLSFPEGHFILAINVQKEKERIVSYSLSKKSEAADKAIRESVDIFNEEYGFSA